MTTILIPGSTTLAQLQDIWANSHAVALDPSSHAGIATAQAHVAKAASGDAAVYGVNTGFGKLASVKIAAKDVATLQRNLILSHCCGVGEPLDDATTRLMMVLKFGKHIMIKITLLNLEWRVQFILIWLHLIVIYVVTQYLTV